MLFEICRDLQRSLEISLISLAISANEEHVKIIKIKFIEWKIEIQLTNEWGSVRSYKTKFEDDLELRTIAVPKMIEISSTVRQNGYGLKKGGEK